MYDITKLFKSTVLILSDTHLVTSLGVRMRNPIQKNGRWIGWTENEVAAHLESVKKYKESLPKNGRGC